MSLFCRTQRKIFWRMWETEQFWGTIDFHSIFFPTMEVNGAPKQPGYKLSSKYLPLCSAEQINLYRFGTTWGWVNDDRRPHSQCSLLWHLNWCDLCTSTIPQSMQHTVSSSPVRADRNYAVDKKKIKFLWTSLVKNLWKFLWNSRYSSEDLNLIPVQHRVWKLWEN